ncbi:MAG: carbohydrate ABC transporter permease [Acutalibacteraceae bacterium]
MSTNAKRQASHNRLNMRRRKSIAGILFLLPWMIGTLFFFIIPFLTAFAYSVSDIKITAQGFELQYAGLKYFRSFFTQDGVFIKSMVESVIGVLPKAFFILSFSIVIAIVLRGKFIGRTAARAVFFFPVVISAGVVIVVLKEQVMTTGTAIADMAPSYIFKAPSMTDLFARLGLPAAILEKLTPLVNQMFDLTWKSGVQILLMLAAINNIPSSAYEAASIEGATEWERFWKITFPMITPTLVVATIYTVIDTFTDYANPMIRLIQNYYKQGLYTESSAAGISYFIGIFALIIVFYAIVSRKVFHANN